MINGLHFENKLTLSCYHIGELNKYSVSFLSCRLYSTKLDFFSFQSTLNDVNFLRYNNLFIIHKRKHMYQTNPFKKRY